MSPICQNFVENAWRKDLCSNCFKSEEEHGKTLKSNGLRKNGLKDGGSNEVNNSNVRRYVGVAGHSVRPGLYSRNYYGSNSWNPLMLDNSNNASRLLKSPGLIKGMNSIIKQENEKNINFNGYNTNSNEGIKIQRRNTDIINGTNIPKDSWILSQIIGEPKTIKSVERSERAQGDSSSDLGSDASHDSSSNSGNTSGCSEGDLKVESDTSSVKSEPDSAHEDEHVVHGILKMSHSLNLDRSPLKNSISFKDDHDVIGYGGDVDYSDDDEEDEYDDDDDDNSSISSSELNSEELSMKRLTERNTNFNSENENLEKDPPSDVNKDSLTPTLLLLDSVKNVNKNSDFNKNRNEKVEDFSNRQQDVKVKLKRSQPIIGSKPQIKSLTSNVPSHVLSSQTDSAYKENVPMQGIKPKFVSREEEMKENTRFDEIYQTKTKVTSIDDVCSKMTSVDKLSPKITSIDNIIPKVTSEDNMSPKITNIDVMPIKLTSVDNISPKMTSVDELYTKTNTTADSPSKDVSLHCKSTGTTSLSSSQVNASDSITNSLNTTAGNYLLEDCKPSKSEIVQGSKNDADAVSKNVNKIDTSSSSKTLSDSRGSSISLNKFSDHQSVNDKYESDKLNINNSKPLKNNSEPPPVTNTEKTIDYSVNSAQSNQLKRCEGNLDESACNKSNASRDMLEKVSSAVVPLNMITIQRRSSFMESQLGGADFSVNTSVSSSPTCKPDLILRKSSLHSQKESVTSENKDLSSGNSELNKTLMNNVTKSDNSDGVVDSCSIKPSEKSTDAEFKKIENHLGKEMEGSETVETESKIDGLNFKINTYENSKKDKEENRMDEKESGRINENINIGNERNFKYHKESPLKKLSVENGIEESDLKLITSGSEPLEAESSQSSSLSTFGTPVPASNGPNSSFLHSGVVRKVTEKSEINSIIYSTPEFLKDIKSRNNQLPVTASIQKSALYAPSSSLKGVPLGKPATTPKPNYLRDKPKIPIKPFVSSSNIYNRDFISPKPNQESTENSSENIPLRNTQTNILSTPRNSYENLINGNSSTFQESPKALDNEEVVYDIPVTVTSTNGTTTFSAPSPSSSSSGYSTTSNLSQTVDNVKDEGKEDGPDARGKGSSNHLDDLVRAIEIDDSFQKAKFEATKNILSESLTFEHKPIPKRSGESSEDDGDVVASEENELDVEKITQEENKVERKQNEKLTDSVEDNTESMAIESTGPTDTYQSEMESTHSYVNIDQPYENHQDADSYSSFTDDFDDDEEESEQNKREYVNINTRVDNAPPLRRTERSSSATPMLRNSVGPINYYPISTSEINYSSKSSNFPKPVKAHAVRSQSVPRSVDTAIDPSIFGKSRPESSSMFGFVKSGFFRPSSPPSTKRKNSSERGRDRTKKSHSGFSLRKLLRLGSGEKSFRSKEPTAKEQDKLFQRETRKMKLQIIHPLDYNTNGVEVISRPEKKSPTYDFTGINDPFIQEALRQQALETSNNNKKKTDDPSKGTNSTGFESSSNKAEVSGKNKNNSERKVEKKNSFLRKKRKTEKREPEKRDDVISVTSYVRPSEQPSKNEMESTQKNNEYNSHKSKNMPSSGVPGTNLVNINLGFNSEGRPRPPPPPRKTSLDSNSQDALRNMMNPPKSSSDSNYSVGVTSASGSRPEGDTSSLSSTCSSTRPSRPPPPRRMSNTAGLKAKDSLYANLGNARAPFTPRKPGRTSSIKDEEREKRKAPNPPPLPNQYHKLRHQVSDGHKEIYHQVVPTTQLDASRSVKGKAPPAPSTQLTNEQLARNHDYEYIPGSPVKNEPSDDGFSNLPNTHTKSHNTASEHEPPEGYILPAYIQYSSYFKEEKEKQEAVRSSSSLTQEKTTRQRGRRSSIVTNLSLEDQYGAVVFANLEALSNLLDQMCSRFECGGYERVKQQVTCFSSITPLSRDPISCGLRLFYPASASDCKVTLMITPEAKVEADPLLMPTPIIMLKDDIPDSFLPNWRVGDHAFTSGSVWILPEMELCSLEEFSHNSRSLLQEDRASDWERRICLFLLQVVSALKQLQAKGTEETSLDFILVIVNMHNDDNPRLLMAASEGNSGSSIQGSSENYVSLCHCAAAVTQLLLGHTRPLEAAMEGSILCPSFTPSPHAFVSLISTLREERSSSLTKAKCILETILYGPEDMNMRSGLDGETAIQKWLDLERANVLHSLVREQANGSFNKKCILTKFQLLFLVRTNSKALKDAMAILEAPDVTNF